MGISERPKLAEARRASVESGGRPCLEHCQQKPSKVRQHSHRTRSANVNECSGFEARRAT